MADTCTHRNQIRDVGPHARGCEECLRTGGTWLHLRVCATCGKVSCCDSSPHQHAARHFEQYQHPLVRPLSDTEDWLWCYADRVMLD